MAGYHKQHCDVCAKETWHYTSQLNEVICCIHTNCLVRGGSTTEVKSPKVAIAGRLDRTMFRIAEDRRSTKVDVSGEDWADDLFTEEEKQAPALDPSQVRCSFCNTPTDYMQTLTEKKAVIRKVQDMYKDTAGEVHITERVVSKSETVHACPNCVLNIRRPIVAHIV